MPITVNFPEIGQTATYEDGTPQDVIASDFERRRFRSGYKQSPVNAIVGLLDHFTTRPTAPTPARVDGSSVIGLSPDQTNSLLDRVQRTNEVEQNAYQAQIDRAARQKEIEAQREFAMQQNMQQQQYQTQRDTQADKKEEQRRLEGTVKSDGNGGYEWIRPDPVTGKPIIEQLKAGQNEWKTINRPDGGIAQVQTDPTGRIIGTPQTVIEGQQDPTNWQQVGSPTLLEDGRYVVNVINPETRKVETIELPKPAQKPASSASKIKWANGMPYYEGTDPQTGAPVPIPIEIPDSLRKKASESGFDEKTFLTTMMNYAADNGIDLGDPVEIEEATKATTNILKQAQQAAGVTPSNPPAGATGGTTFIAPDQTLVEIVD